MDKLPGGECSFRLLLFFLFEHEPRGRNWYSKGFLYLDLMHRRPMPCR